MANLTWSQGGTYVNGRYTGGTSDHVTIPCRIEQTVGETLEVDGRRLEVNYKVFIDSLNLSQADLTTLTISINGVKRKILKAVPMQTHLKLYL
jgi:hypothetical protein